ncbi:MAG: holo-ACP synthase [Deltaproteobacteria bacterium]|nr:holo-ACP synthase [Deltaproteobacteria bacterium]
MIFSVGVDIASIKRLKKSVYNNAFLDRLLTDNERQYVFTKRHSYRHIAGRFAAKEAVMKALGTGWSKEIGWRDIEIINTPSGRPIVKLYSNAGVITLGKKVFLSLAYAKDIALAFAIVE